MRYQSARTCLTDPMSFCFAVYGDNRWSPVGGDTDTLDLRRSYRSNSRWEEEEEEYEPLDSFSAASQWWARQGGDSIEKILA